MIKSKLLNVVIVVLIKEVYDHLTSRVNVAEHPLRRIVAHHYPVVALLASFHFSLQFCFRKGINGLTVKW